MNYETTNISHGNMICITFQTLSWLSNVANVKLAVYIGNITVAPT